MSVNSNQAAMSFNSTMVRLKGRDDRNIRGDLDKFQFHNGSIKSAETDKDIPLRINKFQFHNGSIKSCVGTD